MLAMQICPAQPGGASILGRKSLGHKAPQRGSEQLPRY